MVTVLGCISPIFPIGEMKRVPLSPRPSKLASELSFEILSPARREGPARSSRSSIKPTNPSLQTPALRPWSKLLCLQKLTLLRRSAQGKDATAAPTPCHRCFPGTFPVLACLEPAGAALTGEPCPWEATVPAARGASRGSRALREGRLPGEGVPHRPPRQEHRRQQRGTVHILGFHTLCHFTSQFWEIISISPMGPELL